MTEGFNWQCPYCGSPTTITAPNNSDTIGRINTTRSRHGDIDLRIKAIACPNPDCRQLTLDVVLRKSVHKEGALSPSLSKVGTWRLMPASNAKPQPEYIPRDVRETYYEACAIAKLSPKASAALSRRCLQGLIRDFWKIPEAKRGKLGAEISYITDSVDPDTLQAIKDVREVGDIGAHMDKYVDQIVDVDPAEAELLIGLIETLFADWYVSREKRIGQNAALRATVAEKRAALKQAKTDRKIGDSKDD